jgi:cell wall-associated NlpC family hydrolase
MPGGRQHHGDNARRGHRPLLALAATVLACVTLAAFAPPAFASPQDELEAKKNTARQLQAQIEQNQRQAEILNEQYLQAKAAVEDTQRKIGEAEAGILRAQADTTDAKRRLNGRAARLYMGVGNNDPFQINATDVHELGTRAKYGEAAADEDHRLVDKLHVAQERLGIERKNFERVQDEARKQQEAADDALAAVREAVDEDQHMLDGVESDIQQLVNDIAAAKRREDEARARAAYQAVQAASQNSTSSSTPATSRNEELAGVEPFDVPAPGAGAAAAVAYAWAQLGKPYRYAGVGPDAYDCSGLTMMAWQQGGVSMPHGSIAQGAMFPRVPDDQLQPGDLAIYYPDHGHVGMYVGNGQTISATHTGDFVRLQPVFREGYQFSVRPG